MPIKHEQTHPAEAGVAEMNHRAEMYNDRSSAVTVHPVIAALENADTPTVAIDGFLGTSKDEDLRIYHTLDTSRYLDIPKEAIIHIQPHKTGEPGALRAFVRASSEILSVQRTRMRALDWAGGPIAPAPQMGPFLQVGGDWDIIQDNGFRVNIRVNQNQDRFRAFASHSNGSVKSISAEGFVSGPDFEMTITWDNHTKGLYTGRQTAGFFTAPFTGYLKGNTKDLFNPESYTTWHTDRVFEIA